MSEPEQWAVKQHIEKNPKCEWICLHTNQPNLGEEREGMSKLDEVIRTIREDAYEDGKNGAGHPASVDEDKRKVKTLFLDLFKEVGYDQFDFVDRVTKL